MQSLEQQALMFFRSKPADEKYVPYASRHCALAQFGYPDLSLFNAAQRGVPERLYRLAVYSDEAIAEPEPEHFTFGALADRLAAELAK